MPMEDPDDRQKDALRDHWLHHRCMPFPADGLVPREHTRPEPGTELSSGAPAADAADFALALIAGEVKLLSTADNPKSALTALVANAATAFATRHEELVASVAKKNSDRYHPAVPVCAAMASLSLSLRRAQGSEAGSAARGLWATVRDHFVPKFRLKTGKRNVTGPKGEDGHYKVYQYVHDPKQLPYAWRKEDTHGYRCACQDSSKDAAPANSPASSDDFTPASESQLRPLRALLKQPGAEWWVLGRLFLAAVHGHLGWMPARGAPSYGQVVLQRRVERLLLRRRDMPQGEGDPYIGMAAGLLSGLRWQGPSEAEWDCATLTDLAPQDPAALMPAALSYLCQAAVNTDFFQTLLPIAMSLAREIASDLTSPALALESGALGANDWKAMQMHMDNTRRAFLYHLLYLQSGGAALPNGKGRYPPCSLINADFMRDKLLARLATIASYHGWMHKHGHGIVATLAAPLKS